MYRRGILSQRANAQASQVLGQRAVGAITPHEDLFPFCGEPLGRHTENAGIQSLAEVLYWGPRAVRRTNESGVRCQAQKRAGRVFGLPVFVVRVRCLLAALAIVVVHGAQSLE